MVSIYNTAAIIHISMIFNDILKLADQKVCRPVAACGAPTGDPPDPLSIPFELTMLR